MLDEAKILTDMPGINEPGAEHMLTRMLQYALATRAGYLNEEANAPGENTKAFAREMAGMMTDQLKEITNRLNVLIKHYQAKLQELQEAYESLPLEDYPDIQRAETRIQIRLNLLNNAISHATI